MVEETKNEPLGNFLTAFREAFKNNLQYRHFRAYVVGLLISLGSRNLAGLSRVVPDGRNACSLYRFVAEMDWDVERVEQIRWTMLNRHTRRALQAAGRHTRPVHIPGHGRNLPGNTYLIVLLIAIVLMRLIGWVVILVRR